MRIGSPKSAKEDGEAFFCGIPRSGLVVFLILAVQNDFLLSNEAMTGGVVR
jgi:hypothetical protein